MGNRRGPLDHGQAIFHHHCTRHPPSTASLLHGFHTVDSWTVKGTKCLWFSHGVEQTDTVGQRTGQSRHQCLVGRTQLLQGRQAHARNRHQTPWHRIAVQLVLFWLAYLLQKEHTEAAIVYARRYLQHIVRQAIDQWTFCPARRPPTTGNTSAHQCLSNGWSNIPFLLDQSSGYQMVGSILWKAIVQPKYIVVGTA